MSLVNLLLWLMLALIPLVSVLLLAEQNEAKKTAVRSYVRSHHRTAQYPFHAMADSRQGPSLVEAKPSASCVFQFFEVRTAEPSEPVDLSFDWMDISRPRAGSSDIRDASSVRNHCA